jgi:hypothetical protein
MSEGEGSTSEPSWTKRAEETWVEKEKVRVEGEETCVEESDMTSRDLEEIGYATGPVQRGERRLIQLR